MLYAFIANNYLTTNILVTQFLDKSGLPKICKRYQVISKRIWKSKVIMPLTKTRTTKRHTHSYNKVIKSMTQQHDINLTPLFTVRLKNKLYLLTFDIRRITPIRYDEKLKQVKKHHTIVNQESTGATYGAECVYPSGQPAITPTFWWGSCCQS